jgi:hypothetical protein
VSLSSSVPASEHGRALCGGRYSTFESGLLSQLIGLALGCQRCRSRGRRCPAPRRDKVVGASLIERGTSR